MEDEDTETPASPKNKFKPKLSGDQDFINEMSRKLLVEWCHFFVQNKTMPLVDVLFKPYWTHAITKGWISKDGTKILSPAGKLPPRSFEGKAVNNLLKNKDAEVQAVLHAQLKPVGDSVFKAFCPVCEEGVLLVRRDPSTFTLSNFDNCSLCAQRFQYVDIDLLRALDMGRIVGVSGTPVPVQNTFESHLGPFQSFTETCLMCGQNSYTTKTCTFTGDPVERQIAKYAGQLSESGPGRSPRNQGFADALNHILKANENSPSGLRSGLEAYASQLSDDRNNHAVVKSIHDILSNKGRISP